VLEGLIQLLQFSLEPEVGGALAFKPFALYLLPDAAIVTSDGMLGPQFPNLPNVLSNSMQVAPIRALHMHPRSLHSTWLAEL